MSHPERNASRPLPNLPEKGQNSQSSTQAMIGTLSQRRKNIHSLPVNSEYSQSIQQQSTHPAREAEGPAGSVNSISRGGLRAASSGSSLSGGVSAGGRPGLRTASSGSSLSGGGSAGGRGVQRAPSPRPYHDASHAYAADYTTITESEIGDNTVMIYDEADTTFISDADATYSPTVMSTKGETYIDEDSMLNTASVFNSPYGPGKSRTGGAISPSPSPAPQSHSAQSVRDYNIRSQNNKSTYLSAPRASSYGSAVSASSTATVRVRNQPLGRAPIPSYLEESTMPDNVGEGSFMIALRDREAAAYAAAANRDQNQNASADAVGSLRNQKSNEGQMFVEGGRRVASGGGTRSRSGAISGTSSPPFGRDSISVQQDGARNISGTRMEGPAPQNIENPVSTARNAIFPQRPTSTVAKGDAAPGTTIPPANSVEPAKVSEDKVGTEDDTAPAPFRNTMPPRYTMPPRSGRAIDFDLAGVAEIDDLASGEIAGARLSKALDPVNNLEAQALIKQRRKEIRMNSKKFLGPDAPPGASYPCSRSVRLHQFFRRFSKKARQKDRDAKLKSQLPRSNTQTRAYYEEMRQAGQANGMLHKVKGAMSRSYSALESLLHGVGGKDSKIGIGFADDVRRHPRHVDGVPPHLQFGADNQGSTEEHEARFREFYGTAEDNYLPQTQGLREGQPRRGQDQAQGNNQNNNNQSSQGHQSFNQHLTMDSIVEVEEIANKNTGEQAVASAVPLGLGQGTEGARGRVRSQYGGGRSATSRRGAVSGGGIQVAEDAM